MRLTFCLFALLLLTAYASADNPPVTKDGRTWVWCAPLKMYRPDGAGWLYDADRQTWTRAKPAAPQPVAQERPPRLHAGLWWRWNGSEWVPAEEGWEKNANGLWSRTQPRYSLPLYPQQSMSFSAAECFGGT